MPNIARVPSFFGRFLTVRQFVTRRLVVSGIVAVGLLMPSGFWLGGMTLNGTSGAVDQSGLSSTGEAETARTQRLLKVAICELKLAGPDSLLQSYTGIVAARRASRLASKQVARVESVRVDLGDDVDQGQLLIQLDVQQLQAQRQVATARLLSARAELAELSRGPRIQDIAQAVAQVNELQANLKLSRANFERITELRRSSAISKQEFDESQYALDAIAAKLESANQNLARLREGTRIERVEAQTAVVAAMEAELRRIDADIEDRSIRAPFEGWIQARLIDEGSIVSPGQALLEIMERAPYEVRVGLPPELAQGISSQGMRVKIDGRLLEATVKRIAPAINESTRTREVVLQLSETASQQVSVGSAVKVAVQVPVTTSGYWVPSNCLTAGPRGLWAVYVAATQPQAPEQGVSRIERRQVELLRAQGEWSEIQGPLAPSDQLVIEGVHRATPGQLVRVFNADRSE